MKFYSNDNNRYFQKEEDKREISIRKQKFSIILAINALIEIVNKKDFDKYDNLAQRYLLGLTDPEYNVGYNKNLQKIVQDIYSYLKTDFDKNYETLKNSPLCTNFLVPLSASMPWEEFWEELHDKYGTAFDSKCSKSEIMAECMNAYFDKNSTCEMGIDLVEIFKICFNGKIKTLSELSKDNVKDMQDAAIQFRKNLQNNYVRLTESSSEHEEK